ncbi:MAG: phosphoribosylglycinamide formyltransferase [Saprospiraceae bacterium]|nr:phosphoribosylglycinamide formyltransferase [Saprospiraceae bacterium]
MKRRIAIFASGGGSNAEAIINHFKSSDHIEIALIVSNKKSAYVLERAQNHKIAAHVIHKKEFYNSYDLLDILQSHHIDYIVLAGFLLLIPNYLIQAYPDRIINIHPALLPKYGGKGMYGHHVHQAVFDNFEKESGITIHLVNDKYDEGEILFQSKVELGLTDTPDIIAKKVLSLEHTHYPKVIEQAVLESFDQ